MKKFITLTALLSTFFTFSQTTKIIFDKLGVQVSYSYESAGTLENPDTSTNFTKYKFIVKVTNSTTKFYDVKADISYNHMLVESKLTAKSDDKFVWNNSISSGINLNYFGQKCQNYPKDDLIAHLFVICPNDEIEIEKEFIYPTNFGANPPITWTNTNIKEVRGQSIGSLNNSTKLKKSLLNTNNDVKKLVGTNTSITGLMDLYIDFLAKNDLKEVSRTQEQNIYTKFDGWPEDKTINYTQITFTGGIKIDFTPEKNDILIVVNNSNLDFVKKLGIYLLQLIIMLPISLLKQMPLE